MMLLNAVKNILLSAFLLLLHFKSNAQVISNLKPLRNDISQLSFIKWDTQTGVPYKRVPGANLGTTSFDLKDQEYVAFLCNSTNEVLVVNRVNGSIENRFPVDFTARDIVYDNKQFYVLGEHKVSRFDQTGNWINDLVFPESCRGVERLARYNNSTFLLLPSGNSLKIESTEGSPFLKEFEGTITNTGLFVKTGITGTNSYSVSIINNDTANSKIFKTDKKLAGVFVVGATTNRIVLDLQTYISENPIQVERAIISISLTVNGPDAVIFSSTLPECYYVLSTKDFLVSKNGNIINMLTAPSGVYVFSLSEKSSGPINDFPESINSTRYHFNNNLLKTE